MLPPLSLSLPPEPRTGRLRGPNTFMSSSVTGSLYNTDSSHHRQSVENELIFPSLFGSVFLLLF